MTIEELEKKVKHANSKTDWKQLHSEAIALLKSMSEEERMKIVRSGKWTIIEEISMQILYPGPN